MTFYVKGFYTVVKMAFYVWHYYEAVGEFYATDYSILDNEHVVNVDKIIVLIVFVSLC